MSEQEFKEKIDGLHCLAFECGENLADIQDSIAELIKTAPDQIKDTLHDYTFESFQKFAR